MKKRMVVPKTPVFYTECIRMMRRVHQEPLYGTARPFRTPGGHLRYRMLHRQKGERPCLRRIPQTARKEKAIAKSAARNAAASKKITAKKFAMPPQSYSVQFRDMELKILGISNSEKVLDTVKDYVENGAVWV